ncbi:quinolinate synthase [Candidatus Heimdallarchaeota archaeon B3_Heim]|nr:MAG: quinolinate synthase [Candidatus Heimdallarchaeota archaeon B3_Heim]
MNLSVSGHSPSKTDLELEIERLYEKMKILHWTKEDCELIAPLTWEINHLKKEKDAVILAHSYQLPQIIFGVADYVGDSYSLSRQAMDVQADTIVFCGVEFMAETAKILNPEKRVLLPSLKAGCSLAEGISVEDVKNLRNEYPGVPIACYVNTSAAVKAECDVCVTSSNAIEIIKKLDSDKVIFVPDRHMMKNLGPLTGKDIIGWDAECIVHDQFTGEQVQQLRSENAGIKILAHTECDPSVVLEADYVGGTSGMIKYVRTSNEDSYALITECGLSDRLKVEFPNKTILGSCVLCPYMKAINLENTLEVLRSPQPEQIIEIPLDIASRAKASLKKMFEMTSSPRS